MKKLFAIILTLFATSAFAIGLGNDNPPGGGTQIQGQAQGQIQGQAQGQITNVDVSNRISNDTRANAAAFAGGGSAKSNANSNSGGNTQSVTVTDSGQMNYSGKYEVRNVPSVFSGNVYPTAPCMGSSTVGAAGVGFGVSFGTSWTDDECGKRELSRSFQNLADPISAKEILCSSKYADVVTACKLDATK